MTERARYWAAQLAAWERSGLTQAEYCRRHGIKAGNFAWWKRRLLGATGERNRQRGERARPDAEPPQRHGRPKAPWDRPTRSGQPSMSSEWLTGAGAPTMSSERASRRARPAKVAASFVELPVTSAWPAPMYEVVLPHRRVIRVPSPFDPQILSLLISVVESC